jgi:hypothetical protein
VHRLHPPVAAFCRELAAELGHPTQCNAYLTPGGQNQGFDFHHDTHDVFVLQVSGRKRWIVHEPVVRLPLSSQPQAGAHLVPEGAEPLMDVELLAGDALYLPRGLRARGAHHRRRLRAPHRRRAVHHLVRPAAGRADPAGEREEFRDALPVQPADSLDALLPGFLRSAADWLESVPLDEVRRLAADRLARSVPVEPLSLLATASAVRSLDASTVLRPRRDSPRRCG